MDHSRNDGHKPNSKAHIQPNIGLESEIRKSVVETLNHVLANVSVLSQKTRNAQWNIFGPGFLYLHQLFENQYRQLNRISERIAVRIRILGGTAIGSHQEFIDFSQLEEQPGAVPDILHLLADHESSIRLLREDVKKCSEEFEDEGTNELLVNLMSLHEKMAWMLRSFLENGSVMSEDFEKVLVGN